MPVGPKRNTSGKRVVRKSKPAKKRKPKSQAAEEIRLAKELHDRTHRRLKMEAITAAGKKLKDMPADRVPPAMIDAMTDAAARNPKGGLSLSMEEILHLAKESEVIVVKTPKGAVTNREEFIQGMTALGFKVVFLEYNVHAAVEGSAAPVIERQRWAKES